LKAGHEQAFKPAKTVKDKLHVAPYEYMNERVELKKNYRDREGGVKIGPKQILTNPPLKIQASFEKLPHLPD